MGVGSSTSKASGGASPPVPAGAGASSASAGAAAGADKGELGVVPQSSLDISYVTGRVLAAGRPSVRETLLDDHRNNVAEMAAFLGQKHSDAYLLLNLSNKNRTSIPYSKFDNRVVEFIPYSRPDLTDDTPCMGEVFRACYCLKFWLEWGAETTVVAFCNNGVYRTGFILAAFLVYMGQFDSMGAALAFFSRKRLEGHINADVAASAGGGAGDDGGEGGAPAAAAASYDPSMSIYHRMMPTWRFLAGQLDRAFREPASLPKAYRLEHIIIHAPGLKRLSDDNDPVVQILEGPKVLFDSSKDCAPEPPVADDGSATPAPSEEASNGALRWEEGKLLIDVGRILCGDYSIWLLTPARDRMRAAGSEGVGLSYGGTGAGDMSDGGGGGGGSAGPRGGPASRRERRHAARFVFHTSMLADAGVSTFSGDDVDVFRSGIDRRAFSLSLVTADVPVETLLDLNLDKAMKRSFLNVQGPAAVVKGAEEFSAHAYTFPDPQLLKTLLSEGYDETAAVCALQRAGNAMGRAREYLDTPVMREHFKESAAMRDLKLLRETLSSDEVAAALAARANMVIRARGIALEQLDYRSLLDAAKLGNVGLGGQGDGSGKGKGGGRGGRRRKKKKGKGDDSDSDSSGGGKHDDEDGEDEEEDGDDDGAADDAAAALLGGAPDGSAPKLFQGEAAAPDEDEDDEEEVEAEEEDGGPWIMKEHPIFGRWFKMLADGKSKAEVAEELKKDGFNTALLDVAPDAVVPSGVPASVEPIKDWAFIQKYAKMMKVGLPRPVCEHKMLSEGVNPAILDMDPEGQVMADQISPPKKGKAKQGPLRKKLHWVPIRGKVQESSIWFGPPADLVAAAAQLITDEAEFNRLFVQNPEDLKKKKKKEDKGEVQLLDSKRAMNCGIALAKLKMPVAVVVECLTRMSARSANGKHLLSAVEIGNLITLCPTDDETKALKGYKGDHKRLGNAEQFMLAVLEVPAARARAEGLHYQAGFDERVKDCQAKLNVFSAAIEAIHSAARLKRFLKAVLVLGNKLNGITAKARKGIVKAFTANSLHQLHLTKSFDGSCSVLQYLLRLLKKRDPDLLALSKDFKGGELLAQAKRFPLDLMNEEARELRTGLASLEAVVKEAAGSGGWSMAAGDGPAYVEEEVLEGAGEGDKEKSGGGGGGGTADDAPAAGGAGGPSPPAADAGGDAAGGGGGGDAPKKRKRKVRRRVEPLPQFAASAQTEVTHLETGVEAARTAYAGLIKFWREDSQLAPDELFGTLHLFLQTYDGAIRAMAEKKAKEKAAKRRAKELAKQKRRIERNKRRAARGKGKGRGSDDDDDDDDDDSSSSAASESSSESSSSSSSESESETDSSDVEAGAGGGGGGAWAAGGGAAAADDDDDEDEAPAGGGAGGAGAGGGGNPRSALLAAIEGGKKPAAGGAGAGSGSGTPGSTSSGGGSGGGGGGAAGSDPRAGLLAAIRGKSSAAKPSPAAAGGASPAPAAASASPSPADPRAALLAAIAKKGGGGGGGGDGSAAKSTPAAAAASGGAGGAGSGSAKAVAAPPSSAASGSGGGSGGGSASHRKEEDEAKKKDTGWRMGAERDDDPEAGGRNSLLAAIRNKRKE